MRRISISAKGDAPAIQARVSLPPKGTPVRGRLVFVHGLGYSRRDYALDIGALTEKGFAFAQFPLRGHPQVHAPFSLQGCAEDLGRVIDALDEEGIGGDAPLGVIGHSTGTLIALLRAQGDSRIRLLSAVSTITSLSASMDYLVASGHVDEIYWKLHHTDPPSRVGFFQQLTEGTDWREAFRQAIAHKDHPLKVPCRYGLLEIDDYEEFAQSILDSPDALTIAEKITCPVILFSGHGDEMIDPTKTEELYRSLGTPQERTRLIPLDARDHFLNEHWGAILEETVAFFERFLIEDRPQS